MKINPIDNWLVIKPRPIKTKFGSLELPPGVENPILPVLGDVVASGPGRRNENGDILPMRVKKGDVVLLNGLSFRGITLEDGEGYMMLREHEIAAVMTDITPKLALVPTPITSEN